MSQDRKKVRRALLHPANCRLCFGTGRVIDYFADADQEQTKPCPECGGSGRRHAVSLGHVPGRPRI